VLVFSDENSEKQLDTPPAEYRRLQSRLAQSGWMALGSLLERTKPPRRPRYQWSRRVGYKTITVALSAEQFPMVEKSHCQSTKSLGLIGSNAKANTAILMEKPSRTPSSQVPQQEDLGLN